jgi:hypothetical protein
MKSFHIELNATTATAIVTAEPLTRRVYVHPMTSATIYVGPESVTSLTGLKIDNANGIVSLEIPMNETLYAISGSGTPIVSVLVQGD